MRHSLAAYRSEALIFLAVSFVAWSWLLGSVLGALRERVYLPVSLLPVRMQVIRFWQVQRLVSGRQEAALWPARS